MKKFGNFAGDVITLHHASNRYLMSDMLALHKEKPPITIILDYFTIQCKALLGFFDKMHSSFKIPQVILERLIIIILKLHNVLLIIYI